MNGLPSRKWSDGSGNKSLTSQVTWVKGLELIRPSNSGTITEKRILESRSDPKFKRNTRKETFPHPTKKRSYWWVKTPVV